MDQVQGDVAPKEIHEKERSALQFLLLPIFIATIGDALKELLLQGETTLLQDMLLFGAANAGVQALQLAITRPHSLAISSWLGHLLRAALLLALVVVLLLALLLNVTAGAITLIVGLFVVLALLVWIAQRLPAGSVTARALLLTVAVTAAAVGLVSGGIGLASRASQLMQEEARPTLAIEAPTCRPGTLEQIAAALAVDHEPGESLEVDAPPVSVRLRQDGQRLWLESRLLPLLGVVLGEQPLVDELAEGLELPPEVSGLSLNGQPIYARAAPPAPLEVDLAGQATHTLVVTCAP